MRRKPTMNSGRVGLAALVISLVASGASAQQLGPKDGLDLEPVDTGRVATGDMAPDFALRARDGSVIELTDYRGSKNVILVFYRGYW